MYVLKFITVDLQLYKIFKITRILCLAHIHVYSSIQLINQLVN